MCEDDKSLHTDTLSHGTFHTQTPLHTDAFTQKFLHTDAFIHRSFCTQTLLHTGVFTQAFLHTKTSSNSARRFSLQTYGDIRLQTQTLLYRDTFQTNVFTSRNFYAHKFLHTAIFTQSNFCTQKRFLHSRLCTQVLLQRRFCTQKLVRAKVFTH